MWKSLPTMMCAAVPVISVWTIAVADEPLRGQVIADPANPAHLVYYSAKGKHKPVYFCGPGDPEGFLYRDDQEDIIAALAKTGANCLYFHAIRSHGGDGGANENPFIDKDPNKGVARRVLAKWEKWFTRMDRLGIVMYFFFYDDGAVPFGRGQTVTKPEQAFIEDIVNAFEHYRHLIWCVAEEYGEQYNPKRVSAIAATIRKADDHDHVIAVHQNNGLKFHFVDDPNIDQFAIQFNGVSGEKLHNAMTKAWHNAQGRYSLNASENNSSRAQLRDGDRTSLRRDSWACATAGVHYMWLGAWSSRGRAPTREMLEDAGRLVHFMQSTDFNRMVPHDELKDCGTHYVLARPGHSYIAYSSDPHGSIGLKNLQGGTYTLTWFDCLTGRSLKETREAKAGSVAWSPPTDFGNEVAVYVRRERQ